MRRKKTAAPVHTASETPGLPASLDGLVSSIVDIHQQTQDFSARAVNVALTLRNWLIGHRIVEFEQQGQDRAAYGERLLPVLAQRLAAAGLKRVDARELRRFRRFYSVYPHIRESLSPEWRLAPGLAALQAAPQDRPEARRESASPALIHHLSFSHLAELSELPDDTQRRFYELECMRGNWSVRELRRQIDSLYYQRSGLSKDKAELSALAHAAADTLQPAHVIRDPYVFEFLGLRSRDVMAESDLEDALLDRLQDFLLELGHGFCFEARQKRILIGDEHFFIDLVFYHRMALLRKPVSRRHDPSPGRTHATATTGTVCGRPI
ncbi:MAG: hypothetical protein RLZZ182_305 [Pseudomonadota bacterium]|jgi:predicted nuclease of restriction endonuclease-like (RecB) superfamily